MKKISFLKISFLIFILCFSTNLYAQQCGDGSTDDSEQCDDGNAENLDGCDEICDYEEYDDLETANPNIDFSDLTQGNFIDLVAPDPTSDNALEDCTCEWSINPEGFATIVNPDQCETSLSVGGQTQANISVVVDCAGGAVETHNQTLLSEVRDLNLEQEVVSCQLNTAVQRQSNLITLFLFYNVLVFVFLFKWFLKKNL